MTKGFLKLLSAIGMGALVAAAEAVRLYSEGGFVGVTDSVELIAILGIVGGLVAKAINACIWKISSTDGE